jgi:hypothetical protein
LSLARSARSCQPYGRLATPPGFIRRLLPVPARDLRNNQIHPTRIATPERLGTPLQTLYGDHHVCISPRHAFRTKRWDDIKNGHQLQPPFTCGVNIGLIAHFYTSPYSRSSHSYTRYLTAYHSLRCISTRPRSFWPPSPPSQQRCPKPTCPAMTNHQRAADTGTRPMILPKSWNPKTSTAVERLAKGFVTPNHPSS